MESPCRKQTVFKVQCIEQISTLEIFSSICYLTLCILVDFPIHIDTISIGFSILHFKGSQVEVSEIWCISALKVVLIIANSVDPDKMQHYCIRLGVSSIKRVKSLYIYWAKVNATLHNFIFLTKYLTKSI